MIGDVMRGDEDRSKGRVMTCVPEPSRTGSVSGVFASHIGIPWAADEGSSLPGVSPFTTTPVKRDSRLDFNVDDRTDVRIDNNKKQFDNAKSLKNGANSSEDKFRVALASDATRGGTGPGPLGQEKSKEKIRSPGTMESRSIIKDDSRREILREQRDKDEKMKEARKETSTRRVSWVPGVTDNAPATRDKPAYKRRHSAVVKSSEVTFQRQRSFSLDSQQVSIFAMLLVRS